MSTPSTQSKDFVQVCMACRDTDPQNLYIYGHCIKCTRQNHWFLRRKESDVCSICNAKISEHNSNAICGRGFEKREVYMPIYL